MLTLLIFAAAAFIGGAFYSRRQVDNEAAARRIVMSLPPTASADECIELLTGRRYADLEEEAAVLGIAAVKMSRALREARRRPVRSQHRSRAAYPARRRARPR